MDNYDRTIVNTLNVVAELNIKIIYYDYYSIASSDTKVFAIMYLDIYL